MPVGIHWEWRAFGSVSPQFIQKFSSLPVFFEPHTVKDEYLWIPGLEVNAKFRTGAEGGLKFKRLKQKENQLEKWEENPAEIFDFPLEPQAWNTLSRSLQPAGITLPDYPAEPPGRAELKKILEDAGCSIITVRKERETRRWNGVLIEKALITEPQKVVSIGLENLPEENAPLTDDEAKNTIISAIKYFHLADEALRVMNYMEAVKIWGEGKRI